MPYSHKKEFKTLQSARKLLLTELWDAKGILLLEFLDHGATVNAKHCCTTMRHLKDATSVKCTGLLTEEAILLHDHAHLHTAIITVLLGMSSPFTIQHLATLTSLDH
jgi:hypothetical protein